jgi:hypothetical protein
MKRTTHTKEEKGGISSFGKAIPKSQFYFFMHQLIIIIFKLGFSKATKRQNKMDLSHVYKRRTILVTVKIAIKNMSGFYKATLN